MTPEKALKTIESAKRFAYDDIYEEAFNMAIEALKERPHGEWEIYFNSSGTLMRKCTRCGHEFNQNSDAQNFCPNCGADMRKEGDTHDGKRT